MHVHQLDAAASCARKRGGYALVGDHMTLLRFINAPMRGRACRMALMRHSTASPTSTAPWRPRISAYTMLSLRLHRSTPEDPLTNLRLHPMGASLFRPSITAKPSPVSRTCTKMETVRESKQGGEAGRQSLTSSCLKPGQENLDARGGGRDRCSPCQGRLLPQSCA